VPINVRSRNGGKSFELRITHPKLDKPAYRTCSTLLEAQQVGTQALRALDAGQIPAWLYPQDQKPIQTIAQAVQGYLAIQRISPSTENVLGTLVRTIGSVRLSEVNYAWTERWIQSMKTVELHSAPGTIRKKKSALSTVFAWVVRTHPLCLAHNPLIDLPRGACSYDRNTKALLLDAGVDIPEDTERERRISPEEEAKIVAVLQALITESEDDAERARAQSLLLIFRLDLRSAMRLRETYTLTLDQVSVAERTIRLTKTKNGDRRNVPLNTEAVALLQESWPAMEAARKGKNLMFPLLWDGDLDPDALKRTTAALSARYARVFEKAGLEDIRFHDTRHEAVCRWVLNAPKPLTSEFLAKAAGMKDARTRARYLSLRGSELADQLD
jgi:integrase